MRSIGWIITQARLSKRLCAASVTLRVAIKHFLCDELHLYVFLCDQKISLTELVCEALFLKGREKPQLHFRWFTNPAIEQCDVLIFQFLDSPTRYFCDLNISAYRIH